MDEKGGKVGTPIKASSIYNKPTLKFLEQRFKENEVEKERFKQKMRNAIDLAFLKHPKQSLQDLNTTLSKERIQVVLRQNEKGIIYGMTYIDHATKCVFNGSDLGKPYSANGTQRRCKGEAAPAQKTERQQKMHKPAHEEKFDKGLQSGISGLKDLVKEITQSEQEQQLSIEMKREQYKKAQTKKNTSLKN